MRGSGIAAATAAALLVLAVGEAYASQVPPDASWEETYLTSSDGVRLHADVYRPRSLGQGEKTPVILIVSPYLGLGDGLEPDTAPPTIAPYYRDLFDRAFERGYSVVAVAVRGTGASGGCFDFFGAGHQADAVASIRWAAKQPWSTGKVGTYGGSADAWGQVTGLARRVAGHAAAVIAQPESDYYRIVYTNGVPWWEDVPVPGTSDAEVYTGIASYPPSPLTLLRSDGPGALASLPGINCYAESRSEVLNPDRASPFWRARNLEPAATGNDTPTLWAHGFRDDRGNISPDEGLAVYRSQTGPRRIWLGQVWHVPTSDWQTAAGRGAQFIDEAFRWFDRYLLGKDARVEDDPPAVVQQGHDGRWRSEPEWPPRDASYYELPLNEGSYTDGPGNKGEPGWRGGPECQEPRGGCVPGVPQGVGVWTFTRPFPHDAHIAGTPRLTLAVEQSASPVQTVALLYDIDPDNQAAFIQRGASVSPRSGTLSFDLFPQDWDLKAGHRIGVLVTGADDGVFQPGTSRTAVHVSAGRLALPFLAHRRTEFLDGEPSLIIKSRQTFEVEPTGREINWSFPPPLSTRKGALRPLRLKIRPTRTVVGRKTHFCFRTYTQRGRRLRGVTIRLFGQQRRTDRHGHTGIDALPTMPGRYLVEATRRGYRPVRRFIRVADAR